MASVSLALAGVLLGYGAARADQIAALSPGAYAPAAAYAPHAAYPAIFNSREIHSVNVAQFTNWADMLARWERDRRAAAACVDAADAATECAPPEWRSLVRDLRGLPLRTMLQRVNSALNRHPYITSVENWGVPNHWETPYEFLRRNGQCQDYAIAKFMLLRELGMSNEQLRIVVLRDVDRQIDHAVVVAYVDGEALMLDSLSEAVVPVVEAASYRPYYSINETGWWLHLPGAAQPRPTPRYVAATRVGAPAEPGVLRLSMIEMFTVN